MLTELLQYLRNWFVKTKYTGDFVIEDGKIRMAYSGGMMTLLPGQYVRIIGSAMNDGVWMYPSGALTDEAFSGAVWGLAVPPAVAALADEISEWQSKYGTAVASPYNSESYSRGSYSRSKASAGDTAYTWKTAFADRLSAWRKI